VKTNLAAERIRLVFVADEISPELRSILEFLNRQMSETEVFGIEVKQYVDDEGERQTMEARGIPARNGTRDSGGTPGLRPSHTSVLVRYFATTGHFTLSAAQGVRWDGRLRVNLRAREVIQAPGRMGGALPSAESSSRQAEVEIATTVVA
jgi:hypothetical protein